MYAIQLKDKSIELKAKARYYREFKLMLGCTNLKARFFDALENVDVDFLVKWIMAFATDRTITEDKAYDILDEYLEIEGNSIESLYADAAEFLNGMGFFGRLALSEGASIIDYFSDKTNKVSLDEKLATALDTGVTAIVDQMVRERMAEELNR